MLIKNIDEMYEKFPLSMRELHTYLPFGQGMDDKNYKVITNTILSYSPRYLYELFDQNDILLTVGGCYVEKGMSSQKEFEWVIQTKTDAESGKGVYNSRGEAEVNGLKRCFEILEEKLNQYGKGE